MERKCTQRKKFEGIKLRQKNIRVQLESCVPHQQCFDSTASNGRFIHRTRWHVQALLKDNPFRKDMTAYDGDVKKRLGNDAWELLIQYVNDRKISSQQSSDIARLLAERIPQSKIFGAHKNRMKDSAWMGSYGAQAYIRKLV